MNRKVNILNEDSRSQLIQRSKRGDNYKLDQSKGRNRWERRLHSRVSHSVSTYNSINMNKLFKENILDVNVLVNGETDDYIVRMSFAGFLDYLHNQLKVNNGEFNTRVVNRALVSAFNSDQVYIHCSCPDWKYTMAGWATRNDIDSVKGEQPLIWLPTTPPNRRRNPKDTKGAGCKHVLLVLSNNTWLMKVAMVIINYVKYMEKHSQKLYADIIYPAIYQQPYSDDVQLDMFSDDELSTDETDIDTANKYAREKGRFQKGNQSGVQFTSPSKQISIDDVEEVEDEET